MTHRWRSVPALPKRRWQASMETLEQSYQKLDVIG